MTRSPPSIPLSSLRLIHSSLPLLDTPPWRYRTGHLNSAPASTLFAIGLSSNHAQQRRNNVYSTPTEQPRASSRVWRLGLPRTSVVPLLNSESWHSVSVLNVTQLLHDLPPLVAKRKTLFDDRPVEISVRVISYTADPLSEFYSAGTDIHH